MMEGKLFARRFELCVVQAADTVSENWLKGSILLVMRCTSQINGQKTYWVRSTAAVECITF